MTINEKLRALREDHDLTQEQMGALVNSNQRRISRIERNDTKITIEEIQEYCRYFKISADYFLDIPKGYPYPDH